MENSERGLEISGSAQVSEGFLKEDVPEIKRAFDELELNKMKTGEAADHNRPLTLAEIIKMRSDELRQKRHEEKFPHRLFPGKPITSIEELQQHEWVYSLSRHRAIHREALLSEQTRSVMSALQRNNICEALEMTDQEVFDEKIISNRAAYLARIEYRERLFDHACAIHDSVAGVSEDKTGAADYDPAG